MTKENIEFIDAYIFMTYENMFKVIKNNRLKILFPEECNDPFEFMSASPTILKDGYTSFDSNHLRKEYGFLSFTKTYKSPTMWAHYADNHKGCCVHFRFPSLPKQNRILDSSKNPPYKYRELLVEHEGECFTAIQSSKTHEITKHVILWDILYQKKRVEFDGMLSGHTAFGDQVKFKINTIFITKDESWGYEQEQRIIIPTSFPTEVEDNLIFVRGFNPYIKSIMLGMHCPYPEGLTQSLINALTLGEKNGMKITYSNETSYDDQINVSRVKPTSDTFEVISDEHENFLKLLKENGE